MIPTTAPDPPNNSPPGMLLRGIVSGGQTGADRAALDVAAAVGVPAYGWCPRGRLAEDGPIPSRYPLRETPSGAPGERTAWNVFDSDATLVLAPNRIAAGGTALAVEVARRFGRPLLVLDPATDEPAEARRWLEGIPAPVLLNVAGPRESEAPGGYERCRAFLERLLTLAGQSGVGSGEPVPPRRALVTGGAGLLGRWLLRLAPPAWEVHATIRSPAGSGAPAPIGASPAREIHPVELSDAEAVDRLIGDLEPDVVIHTAYSAAHGQRDIWRATRNVAEAATRSGAELVHLSSDMVLDGGHAPYDESAQAAPVNEYGRWKAKAEEFVRHRCPSAAIVRLSLIVEFEEPDPRTMWVLEGLRGSSTVELYTDELRTPILAPDLARQVWEIVRLPRERRRGVWNLAAPEALSRYALGLLIAAAYGLDPAKLQPIATPAEVVRPRDLRLQTGRADRQLFTRPRTISSAAAEHRRRLEEIDG